MKQPNLQNVELLNRLRLDIERAWNQSEDDEMVHVLARKHPELSEDLYEFFADIVAMSFASELAATNGEDRMTAWLESGGFAKIAQARREAKTSSTPSTRPTPIVDATNLVAFLKAKTRKDMDALALALGISSRFLLDLSNHSTVLPEKARLELAQRAEQQMSIARLETLRILHGLARANPMQRAASRSAAFTPQSTTYEAIVNRSGLDNDQKRFWLSLA
jgi:hypothetical protein